MINSANHSDSLNAFPPELPSGYRYFMITLLLALVFASPSHAIETRHARGTVWLLDYNSQEEARHEAERLAREEATRLCGMNVVLASPFKYGGTFRLLTAEADFSCVGSGTPPQPPSPGCYQQVGTSCKLGYRAISCASSPQLHGAPLCRCCVVL